MRLSVLPHPSSGLCTLTDKSGNPCPLMSRPIRTRCAQTAHILDSLPLSPSHPIVLMIGRNPGYEEDISGLPFQGPLSDRFWSAWIPGSGLPSLATLFLTNIARCFHVDGPSPKPSVFRMCREHLIPDIRSIASMGGGHLFLLTMGAEACTHVHALSGNSGMTLTKAFAKQGTSLTISDVPFNCYSTFHPAFCEREERHIYAVQDHLRLLTDAIRGIRPVPSKPSFSAPRSPTPCPSSNPS